MIFKGYSHFPNNIAPTGPAGTAGTAASVQVGAVTTSAPGTQAAVTNSGTEQNAVLDFTIPQGAAGSSGPTDLVSAYSTPSQAAASGAPLVFDQNALTYGTAVSHTAGSSDFTINQPGLYQVDFHGSVSAAPTETFPATVVTSLEENGNIVPGASVPYIFQSSTETAPQSFTAMLPVTTVPATLQVAGEGGSYLANSITLNITRLGDVPTA